MQQSRRSSFFSLAAWLIVLFLLVTYKAGLFVAAMVLASGAIGYLNVFAVLRAGLVVLRRRTISKNTITLVAIAALGRAAISYFGYWALLALCTGTFLIVDGIALRFQGPPAGSAASGP